MQREHCPHPETSLVWEVMNSLEDSYVGVFARLMERGKITPQIREDFILFCATARNIFTERLGEFSLELVYESLPENQWIDVYQQNSLLTEEVISSFQGCVH